MEAQPKRGDEQQSSTSCKATHLIRQSSVGALHQSNVGGSMRARM